MTPKEKAKQLVTEHFVIISDGWDIDKTPDEEAIISSVLHPEYKSQAIQCALITVDYMIKQNNVWIKNTATGTNNYLLEVKREIEEMETKNKING